MEMKARKLCTLTPLLFAQLDGHASKRHQNLLSVISRNCKRENHINLVDIPEMARRFQFRDDRRGPTKHPIQTVFELADMTIHVEVDQYGFSTGALHGEHEALNGVWRQAWPENPQAFQPTVSSARLQACIGIT